VTDSCGADRNFNRCVLVTAPEKLSPFFLMFRPPGARLMALKTTESARPPAFVIPARGAGAEDATPVPIQIKWFKEKASMPPSSAGARFRSRKVAQRREDRVEQRIAIGCLRSSESQAPRLACSLCLTATKTRYRPDGTLLRTAG